METKTETKTTKRGGRKPVPQDRLDNHSRNIAKMIFSGSVGWSKLSSLPYRRMFSELNGGYAYVPKK